MYRTPEKGLIMQPEINNLKTNPKTEAEKIQDLEQNVKDLQQSISALKIIIATASIILFIIILGLIGADVFFLWLFSTLNDPFYLH